MSTKKSTLERLPTVVIENIEPCIDGGRYPVKRIAEQAAARATLKQDKERLHAFSKQLKNADAHLGTQLAKNPELTENLRFHILQQTETSPSNPHQFFPIRS